MASRFKFVCGTIATRILMPIFDFDSGSLLSIFSNAQAVVGVQHSRGESLLMRSTYAPASHVNFAPGAGHGAVGHSPGSDPEIAHLFSELRRYLGMPLPQIAHHVATHPNVIAALEAGRIDLLPGWSETARVVTAYIGIARLDPRPALDRLAVRMGVAINSAPSAYRPAVSAAPPTRRLPPLRAS